MRGARGCLPERCCAPQGGATALHHSAAKGHVAVVKKLLAAGANKNVKRKVSGRGGRGDAGCG